MDDNSEGIGGGRDWAASSLFIVSLLAAARVAQMRASDFPVPVADSMRTFSDLFTLFVMAFMMAICVGYGFTGRFTSHLFIRKRYCCPGTVLSSSSSSSSSSSLCLGFFGRSTSADNELRFLFIPLPSQLSMTAIELLLLLLLFDPFFLLFIFSSFLFIFLLTKT